MPRKPKAKGKTAVGDNLYVIKGSYWLVFTYKGRTYREKIGRVDELPLTSARHVAHELKARIIKHEYIPKREENLIFKELADEYRRWYLSNHETTREKSKETLLNRLDKLVEYFGSREVHSITEFTVEHYKTKRKREGVKENTINTELRILRAVLRKAKEWGLYSGDLPKVSLFKVDDSRERYLTPEEVRRLIDACPEHFKPVVKFALLTGFRAGEIFSLRWENVDLARGYIVIEPSYTKNKERARVPISGEVVRLLREVRARQRAKGIESDYVFTNRSGKPYSYQNKSYLKVFKSACERAGIKGLRFHDLRHSYASYLVMAGVDLYTVQVLLRHKDFRMTRRYAHLSPEHIRRELEKVRGIV